MKIRIQNALELVKLKHKRFIPLMVVFVFLFASVVVVYASVEDVVITDGDNVVTAKTLSSDPYAILAEQGIALSPNDQVTFENGNALTVKRAKTVHFQLGGQIFKASSCGDTVADALADAGIVLGPEDEISVAVDSPLTNDMQVAVSRVVVETETKTDVVPFQTKTEKTDALYAGESRVKTEGVNGEKQLVYQVTYRDGAEIARELVSETVTKPATDKVVEQGSKQKVASTTASKAQSASTASTSSSAGTISGLKYKKVIPCSATAYTLTKGSSGLTASGMRARVGVVAVDPRVIPLGTKLYIASPDGSYVYGYAIAGDTGGAIKGNIVDLFFNTLGECYQFGRRPMNVYVLE